MAERYEIAVIGQGIVGSSIAAHLSKKYNVVAIDQTKPPHRLGSSGGNERMFRRAPGEGKVYEQMARRAYELYLGLEAQTGKTFLRRTGGVDSSTPLPDWARQNGEIEWTRTVEEICKENGLPYEKCTGPEFNKLHPNYRLPDNATVIKQEQIGEIDAPLLWQTFLNIAADNGTRTYFGSKVAHLDYNRGNAITLDDGTRIEADKIICAAGSWTNQLLDYKLDLTIGRRVVAYFEIEEFHENGFVPFCLVDRKSNRIYYGMPSLDGRSVKIAENKHFNEVLAPGADNPPVNQNDLAFIRRFVANSLTGVSLRPVDFSVCKYSITPFGHFVMDRHPLHEDVFIFSPCSGHGFKYAPVYGEIAEALIENKEYRIRGEYIISLDRFRIEMHGKRGLLKLRDQVLNRTAPAPTPH